MSPNSGLVKFREILVVLYRNNETVVLFILKFLTGLILFGNINSIGYYREGFAFAGGFLWTVGLSALFAVAPPTAGFAVLLVAVLIQISLSLELTAIIFMLGFCIIVFYCRIQPNRSFIIIAMVLGYLFRVPYAVVLVAGLYAGFAAIIPVAIGTAVWSFLPLFSGLVDRTPASDLTEFNVIAVTDGLTDIYTSMYVQFTGDFQWIFNSFIFAMVIILVYAISRLTINYAKEISLLLGGVLCLLGIVMSSGIGGTSAGIGASIFFVFVSVILTQIFKFFDTALDYKSVEYVEFQDEDNYYYVKIVNKLKPTEPVVLRTPTKRAPAPKTRRREHAPAKREDTRRRPVAPAPAPARGTKRRLPPVEPEWDDDEDYLRP